MEKSHPLCAGRATGESVCPRIANPPGCCDSSIRMCRKCLNNKQVMKGFPVCHICYDSSHFCNTCENPIKQNRFIQCHECRKWICPAHTESQRPGSYEYCQVCYKIMKYFSVHGD